MRRSSVALLVMAIPVAVAMAALVAAGWLSAAPAIAAGSSILAGIAVVALPHLKRVDAIGVYLDRLAQGTDAGEPLRQYSRFGDFLNAPLLRAVGDAERAWARRRRDLEALIAANDAVLAGLPDPLLMLDDRRRITRANKAAEAVFGPLPAGRDLFAVLREPSVGAALTAAMTERRGQLLEFFLPVPVEQSFIARIEPLAQPIADGTIALIALHDVTATKRTEQMRADFVANVSHELRTPLSSLVGFIETLQGPAKNDAEARERFLGIMQEQTGRMSRLVADLLSLSRIELNEHTQPAGRAELAAVIQGVVNSLQMRAADKRISIVIDRAPAIGARPEAPTPLADLPAVAGDADELAQLFQNLIDNAIKYGTAGSSIRIAAWTTAPLAAAGGQTTIRRLDKPGIAIAVGDESEGIAREHLPRLTERFYRVDTARSRALGGTGLGLAIVKHIVSRHRGHLEIDSVVGRGSTFTVHLPVAPG